GHAVALVHLRRPGRERRLPDGRTGAPPRAEGDRDRAVAGLGPRLRLAGLPVDRRAPARREPGRGVRGGGEQPAGRARLSLPARSGLVRRLPDRTHRRAIARAPPARSRVDGRDPVGCALERGPPARRAGARDPRGRATARPARARRASAPLRVGRVDGGRQRGGLDLPVRAGAAADVPLRTQAGRATEPLPRRRAPPVLGLEPALAVELAPAGRAGRPGLAAEDGPSEPRLAGRGADRARRGRLGAAAEAGRGPGAVAVGTDPQAPPRPPARARPAAEAPAQPGWLPD